MAHGDPRDTARPRADAAPRRTYLAQERTLLAWWRSGLAALAVAVGIGRLVPALLDVSAAPFLVLGMGYALLGLAFFVVGARRDRVVKRQLADDRFEPLDDRIVGGIAVALLLLGVVTMILLIAES